MKTNLLFFTKGKPTEKIWYYDLSDVKVGKKMPLTLKHFEDFAATAGCSPMWRARRKAAGSASDRSIASSPPELSARKGHPHRSSHRTAAGSASSPKGACSKCQPPVVRRLCCARPGPNAAAPRGAPGTPLCSRRRRRPTCPSCPLTAVPLVRRRPSTSRRASGTHRWPDVLPNGLNVLFTIARAGSGSFDEGEIAVASLVTGERRLLLMHASCARYVPTGHLVYMRGGSIMAVPFVGGAAEMRSHAFALCNFVGASAWVGLCLGAGLVFGNVPIVKQNFSLVTIGIVVVSLLPVVVSAFRRTLPETQSG